MDTLLLDTVEWDLVADANGNIAKAGDPYSQAQDAASACRLFSAELWYNKAKGLPFWQSILGKLPPLSLVRAKFVGAALTVPGVVAARCYFTSFLNRRLGGQVQVFDKDGNSSTAAF